MKLELFFEQGIMRRYEQGEVILSRGDEPASVYLITEGVVKVYSIMPDGEENIHVLHKPGEVLPLMSAVNGVAIDLFYEAMNDVRMLERPITEFNNYLKRDAEAAIEVAKMALQLLQIYRRRVGNLEHTKASQRVACRLELLAERFGRPIKNGIELDLPLTHQNLAGTVNLSRETASRVIEKLGREGIISYEGQTLILRRPEALRDLAGHDDEEYLREID